MRGCRLSGATRCTPSSSANDDADSYAQLQGSANLRLAGVRQTLTFDELQRRLPCNHAPRQVFARMTMAGKDEPPKLAVCVHVRTGLPASAAAMPTSPSVRRPGRCAPTPPVEPPSMNSGRLPVIRRARKGARLGIS